MEPITVFEGIAAPLDRANVDTDMIIPKQFLKKIERTGFGIHLFHELRYTDYEGTIENKDFILNNELYRNATLLLSRDNFGSGSSREHAPWALFDYGFRVIIAPSFADIFYNNCSKNGILPVKLSSEEVDQLFKQVYKLPGSIIKVDLKSQKVTAPNGMEYIFKIDPFIKLCLIKGLDQIEWTLKFDDEITKYEIINQKQMPWL
jgi:3-isopropylmalate/(R)-2-methylmalate dehydratase small subunit